MDTTEQMIKMSVGAERSAPELFFKSTYDVHDYTFQVEGNDLLWWLPRQDQLQEMVGQPNLAYLLLDFRKFTSPDEYCLHGKSREAGFYNQDYCKICTNKRIKAFKTFTSMEQLWLAFVMNEKFGKVWDGDKWI